jgi:hypothetical protein
MKWTYCLSPVQVDHWEDESRRETWNPRGDHGPIRGIAGWIFGTAFIHKPYEILIDWCLGRDRSARACLPLSEATARYRRALEWFWFWTTIFYSFVYAIVWYLVYSRKIQPDVVCEEVRLIGLAVLTIVCVHRLVDIAALAIRLFVIENFRTSDVAYSLFLSTLAYFQIILCFGVFYLADVYFCDDLSPKVQTIEIQATNFPVQSIVQIDDRTLESYFGDAFYLSALIITTLGTGDYEFQHFHTQAAVLAEVVLGMMFVVVVFQRVLGGHSPIQSEIELAPEFRVNLHSEHQYLVTTLADTASIQAALLIHGLQPGAPIGAINDGELVHLIPLPNDSVSAAIMRALRSLDGP